MCQRIPFQRRDACGRGVSADFGGFVGGLSSSKGRGAGARNVRHLVGVHNKTRNKTRRYRGELDRVW
eukprot:750568-Hanusia_phi.AAC.6